MTVPTESPAGRAAASLRFWELTPREHWTDAQRLAYAGMTFVADEAMERIRLVRDRYPDLVPQLPVDRVAALPAYERTRQAALDGGKTLQLPKLPTAGVLSDAAAVVRAGRLADPIAANREGRRRFQEVAQAGGDTVAAFKAWVDSLKELRAAWGRWDRAQAVLGAPSRGVSIGLPSYSDEVQLALTGDRAGG
jgi:hypothetical protein